MKHVHGFSDYNGTRTYNHLVGKWTLNPLAQLALNDWAVLWVRICTAHLTVCSYHVTHAFQSQSILYICLNVKELLTQNRRDIWCLSDCNELSACGFDSCCSYLNFRYRACFEHSFLDIQVNTECGFPLKRLRDMIRTYSHIDSW